MSDAKFELLKRGQYTLNASSEQLSRPWFDRKTPIELQEARNAVQIARWAGAEQYASDTFQKAVIGSRTQKAIWSVKAATNPSAPSRVKPSRWPRMHASSR